MPTNELTGKPGESDNQFELRIRTENPFASEATIQAMIAARRSKDTIAKRANALYPAK